MGRLVLLAALALGLGGCAATAVVGAAVSVVGAGVDIAGSAVSATIDVVGSGVSGAIDLATSDDDGASKAAGEAPAVTRAATKVSEAAEETPPERSSGEPIEDEMASDDPMDFH